MWESLAKKSTEDLHPTVKNRFMETLIARGFFPHHFLKCRVLFLTTCLTSLLDSCTDTLKSTSVKPNPLSSAPMCAFLLVCPAHWRASDVLFSTFLFQTVLCIITKWHNHTFSSPASLISETCPKSGLTSPFLLSLSWYSASSYIPRLCLELPTLF